MPPPHVVPPTVVTRTAHNRAGIPVAGAALRGAVLRGAALRGAVLRGAALRGAVLRGAALRGAALRGAVLRGAALRGAALRGAAGGLRAADAGAAGVRAAGVWGVGVWGLGVWGVGVWGLGKVEAAEEQGRRRVVGQFGHPTGQGAAECLRRVRVAGHLVTGGEEGFGALPHPPQRAPRVCQVCAFGGQIRVELGVEIKCGHADVPSFTSAARSRVRGRMAGRPARKTSVPVQLTSAVKRPATLRSRTRRFQRITQTTTHPRWRVARCGGAGDDFLPAGWLW
ncbi:pentapeptide repeat-containing protein [Micromonospora sp. NPDC005203]|uniref:pentapeptide repeat-containing protein n=1 Tax=Micromonospora sp. NPDC005203 TaxID=3364226 RepID=UPI0036D066B7